MISDSSPSIGVLAVQGDFEAHARALRRIGARTCEVRCGKDLSCVDALVIPGGESTTMLKFIEEDHLADAISAFARNRKPILGTCAGVILLAREVYNPAQPSLALLDITIERNAYGRQVDSFIAEVETLPQGEWVEAVFIRAPRIKRVGPNVSVIARLNGEPILVKERNVLAATFHPELTEDPSVHRLFVDMVRAQADVRVAQRNLEDRL